MFKTLADDVQIFDPPLIHEWISMVKRGFTDEVVTRETEIIKKVQFGNEKAYELLYETHGKAVLNYIIKELPPQCKHYSEDILGKSFYIAYNNISSFRFQCRFRSYVISIAKFKIKKTLEKHYRSNSIFQSTDFIDDWKSVLQGNDLNNGMQTILNKEIIQYIYDGIDSLKSKEKEIIHLMLIEGYTESEAAKFLRLPIGTVRTRKYRGIESLRQRLKKSAL